MDVKTCASKLSRNKVNCILCLVLFSLVFAGCSQETTMEESNVAGDSIEQSKAAIETVLEKEFTGPDEEVIQLKEEMDEKLTEKMEGTSEGSVVSLSEEDPEQRNFSSYLENTYAPYFTNKALNDFSKTFAFSYHQPGDEYKMTVADMKIDQSDSASSNYHFTIYVDYEDPSGKATRYEISGSTIIAEEGKIGKIEFDDKDGLSQQINEDTRE